MPMRTREEQRAYQREWRNRRRLAWVEEHGPCVQCGSDEELEVDHRDPEQKLMETHALWSLSPQNPKRIAELEKCQVLCHVCHAKKTELEAIKTGRKLTRLKGCGGVKNARYRCKCETCQEVLREARRRWNSAYAAKKKASST